MPRFMPRIFNRTNVTAVNAVFGGLLFGFDIASMSGIITTQPFLCRFNQFGNDPDTGLCRGPKPEMLGFITGVMALGSLIGSFLSGWLSDKYGRKKSIMCGSLVWIIGSIITCFSLNIGMLIAGRAISGISVGICSAQVPVYITEIAPARQRGLLVGFQQWSITWGIDIMSAVCYGCAHLPGELSFRVPWGLQAIPAIFLFLGLFFQPESPRWLLLKNQEAKAREALVLLRDRHNPTSPLIEHEFRQMRESVQEELQHHDVSWRELFRRPMIIRTKIGVSTQVWSQFTGMNVMMYYIVYVFNMAGLRNSTLFSNIIYAINVVMTVPGLLCLDLWGRRPLLLLGAGMMCACHAVCAIMFGVHGRAPRPGEFTSGTESMVVSGPPAQLVIAASCIFVAAFAMTWGPVSWTYPPELFPLRVRAQAVALTTSANWVCNASLAQFVPVAFQNIGWKVYLLFAVLTAVMFLHVYFFFPETANKTLEEVDEIFDDKRPGAIRYIGTPAWRTKNNRKSAAALASGDTADLPLPDTEKATDPKPESGVIA